MRTVALYNAAPLAALADVSATAAMMSLAAADDDTLAGLHGMLGAAERQAGALTAEGRRRVCVCKRRTAAAIGLRGGNVRTVRSLDAIIRNPVTRTSRQLTAAAPGAKADPLAVDRRGGRFDGWNASAQGLGSWSTSPSAAPARQLASATESAAEGLGSWLSSLFGGNTGNILGALASFIPVVGPVVGAGIAVASQASAARSAASQQAAAQRAAAQQAANQQAAAAQAAAQAAALQTSDRYGYTAPAARSLATTGSTVQLQQQPAATGGGMDTKTLLMIGGGLLAVVMLARR